MNDGAMFFKALSEETRLAIIFLLHNESALCVCDIESILKESQSKVSRHLRYLTNAHLLVSKRKNAWVYYSLNGELSEIKRELLIQSTKLISSDEKQNLINALASRLLDKKEC